MRISGRAVADAVAWAGVFALVGAGLVVVRVLGFPGVLLLGLLTTQICVRAELSEGVPAWGQAVFEARGRRARSAEERASEAAGRERIIAPLRYGRECGLVLIAAGLLGTVWQFWD